MLNLNYIFKKEHKSHCKQLQRLNLVCPVCHSPEFSCIVQKEHKKKCSEHEQLRKVYTKLQEESKMVRRVLEQRDQLIQVLPIPITLPLSGFFILSFELNVIPMMDHF